MHPAGEAAGDGFAAAPGIGDGGEAFEEEGAGKLRRVGRGVRVWRAAGALPLRLGEAETVEAARGERARQRGESHPWTEGREGHAEREQMQQAADHGGEHGYALQRGAPDGAVVPVPRAGDHEALQGIMMLRGEAPEFGERGSGHQGQEYTPGPRRVGLEGANERRCAAGARGIGCVGADLRNEF